MRLILALVLAASLTGCADFKGVFANRLSCTLDRTAAFMNSLYGPIGITTKVAEADAVVLCSQHTK